MYNRTVIVTGGSSGIGHDTALRFAKLGHNVVIADVAEEAGKRTLEELKAIHSNVLFINTDVSREADVKNLAETTYKTFGGIHYLANIAGIPNEMKPSIEQSVERWDAVINISLKGTFLCSKIVAPYMMKNNWGRIVNCSSIAGIRSQVKRTAYGAAKAGIIRLSEVFALEWAPYGITVNTVIPGMTATPLQKELSRSGAVNMEAICKAIPMGRYAEPDEIARAILFFCADESGYITGANLPVDGGYLCYTPFQ